MAASEDDPQEDVDEVLSREIPAGSALPGKLPPAGSELAAGCPSAPGVVLGTLPPLALPSNIDLKSISGNWVSKPATSTVTEGTRDPRPCASSAGK